MTQTLDELRAEIDELHRLGITSAYKEKQLHKIPPAPVVDRVQYILRHCAGKRVLHLGCGWPPGHLHQAIEQVATVAQGMDIDVPQPDGDKNICYQDLDRPLEWWGWRDRYDLVVVAEILEHLGNPGMLLKGLHEVNAPLLVTVPNAFAAVGRRHITGGLENVHIQHTAWYSYRTLRTLVERYGYAIVETAWYNCPRGAQPQESEGLCMLVR